MATVGGPRAFSTDKDFKEKFVEYVDYCRKKQLLANIAGFAVYCDMCRDTFYAQKEYYPETFSKVQDILEDYTINAPIKDVFKIFYMKAKFNYKDGREIDQNSGGRIVINNNLPSGDGDE